jgi:single-stranded-DNA-specific exonuclease
LFQADWHQGVIGLLASRLKEKFYRPVIVFAPADEVTKEQSTSGEYEIKGSGRSIPGFHLRDALDLVAKRLPHVLSKFGGHAMAAGLSIKKKHIEEFKEVFEEVASQLLTQDLLVNVLMTDGTPAPQDFNVSMARELRFVAPWGQNFPEPLFDAEFNVANFRLIGADKNHLKLTLQDPTSHQVYDAILFNIDRFNLERHDIEANKLKRVHVVFEMDVNEFRGNENLQLMIRHLVRI